MKITLKLSDTPPELNLEGRTSRTLALALNDRITEEFLDFSPEACFRQFETWLRNNQTYLLSVLRETDEIDTESARDDPDFFVLPETPPVLEAPNG